ncbi:putative retrotransposon protein [Tanacetum coccineum]|uniref:Retrotransposon protein n=1 Tax=Tanacetum coccineum TaxID=301880 RepID=A0ABQ5BNQ7_9ASTR
MDQFILQRRAQASHDTTTRPSSQPQDDTSKKEIQEKSSPSDSTSDTSNDTDSERTHSGFIITWLWHVMALNNAQTKINSSDFRSMLGKHQPTGPNINEWFRALKLVVHTEKLQDVFETALPPAPAAGANAQALADWAILFDRHNEVMVTELQKMYGKPLGVELQELMNMFHSCKQAEGKFVSDHVILMKSYLDQLATHNYAFPDKVSISFILNSLSGEFQAFVQNYNMQSMEKTISEVHSLLIEFEKSIKRNKQQIVGASSTPHVMAIQSGRVQKNKPQGKAKGKEKGKGLKNSYPTKPKKPQPYKKERPAKDGQCHHCKEEGHWKRNCPVSS